MIIQIDEDEYMELTNVLKEAERSLKVLKIAALRETLLINALQKGATLSYDKDIQIDGVGITDIMRRLGGLNA